MTPFLLVGVGGFVGSALRHAINLWVMGSSLSRLPLATFLINVTGSFLLGCIGMLVAERVIPYSDSVRLLVGVGLLGGYTTFSTYELETDALLRAGETLRAALYFCLSPIVGLLALRLGVVAAQALKP